MDGYATIAVELCYRPGFHHNDHWAGMGVPTCVTTGLNHDLGLQNLGWTLCVDAKAIGAKPSCERFERERRTLSYRRSNVNKNSAEQSRYSDCAHHAIPDLPGPKSASGPGKSG